MVLLSLGSNLASKYGDRFENLKIAMSFLDGYGIKILRKSSFYETPSYPEKSNPKFINLAISVDTNLPPVDLMSVLIHIEEKLERKRNKKNEPRTCDIDIIDYKNQIINFQYRNLDLIVPHKSLANRNFVLIPLQEIVPEWKHPETKEIISSLIEKLPNDERKSILKVKEN